MQPSELWRRGVVMPLNAEAAWKINEWDVDEHTPVEYLPIAKYLFNDLWSLGLFAGINRACGSLIDDYESEWLNTQQLPAALRVVNELLRQRLDVEAGKFLRELAALMGRAIDNRLPLYFEC